MRGEGRARCKRPVAVATLPPDTVRTGATRDRPHSAGAMASPAARASRAARAPARALRRAGDGAARGSARRARADGALAVDERPQPRRRLPAPARALPGLAGRARRARRGDRGGDPARRPARPEVAAHQGDARGAAARTSTSAGCATRPSSESRDALCALPGVGRKTAACVLLFAYGLRDVPVDTHVSPRRHAAAACCVPARRSTSCTTRCCA